jgi:hypothetical protein
MREESRMNDMQPVSVKFIGGVPSVTYRAGDHGNEHISAAATVIWFYTGTRRLGAVLNSKWRWW